MNTNTATLHGSQSCHGEGACETQWSYEPCQTGPPKRGGYFGEYEPCQTGPPKMGGYFEEFW